MSTSSQKGAIKRLFCTVVNTPGNGSGAQWENASLNDRSPLVATWNNNGRSVVNKEGKNSHDKMSQDREKDLSEVVFSLRMVEYMQFSRVCGYASKCKAVQCLNV